MDIEKIQRLLKEFNFDGWIFTDFHGHDFITKQNKNIRPNTKRNSDNIK